MKTLLLLLAKRFNKTAILFIYIAVLLFAFICYINGSFHTIGFEFYVNYVSLKQEYLLNCAMLLDLLGLFFIILLMGLEISSNVNRYEAYFVALNGKLSFYIQKIITLLIVCFIFVFYLYFVLIFIYFIRFKTSFIAIEILKGFLAFYLCLSIYQCLAFTLILLFKNYFSLFLLFLFYFLNKILSANNIKFKSIIPVIEIKDFITLSGNFEFYFFVLMGLIILNGIIFITADYKC